MPTLGSGDIITWQTSNTSNSSVSYNPTTKIATVTRLNNFNDIITLTATITTSYSTVSFTKNILVGLPLIGGITITNGIGQNGYFCANTFSNEFTIFAETNGETNFNYQVQLINANTSAVVKNITVGSSGQGDFRFVPSGLYMLRARPIACEQTTSSNNNWFAFHVESALCEDTGYRTMSMSVAPNPADDELTLTIKKEENDTETSAGTIELLDQYGKSVIKELITKDKSKIKNCLLTRRLLYTGL